MPNPTVLAAAKSVELFAGERRGAGKPRRRARPKARANVMEAAREGVAEMAASGDWSGATGDHLVALYAWLHRQVYGVECEELDAQDWWLARSAAVRLASTHFGDDYDRAVVFMRWVWKREQRDEEWRRKNDKMGRRIGWRLQFSAQLVTDYRRFVLHYSSAPGER
jgi:hypothetical protein